MDVSLLLLPVQALDVVLRTFVEVDRLLVQQDRRGELIHLADDLGSWRRRVDDHHVVRCDAPEVDLVRRESLPAPEPTASRARSGTILFEQLEQLADVGASEALLVLERQLEQAGLEVARQEQQVVRVDEAFLRIGAEEVFRVSNDELVEWRARRHEDTHRAGSPPGSAQLLPGGCDGARVADQDRRLQAADVDPQLERVGADHAGDLSAAQAGLDLPAMQRQVSRSIAAHALRSVEARREVLSEVAEHHLDLQAAAAENDCLHPAADPWRRDTTRL